MFALRSPIQEAVLLAAGAVCNHFWARFRGRLTKLRWAVQYHRVAVSAQDAAFGTIQVLHNNRPVNNLHIAALQVQNESVRDLQDVELNIACLDGSTMLVSEGSLAGSLQQIPFTVTFNQALQQAFQNPTNIPQATLNYLVTRRDYLIRVFNRGVIANFVLLIERNDNNPPNLTVTCDHVGVRLRRHAPAVMLLGENQLHAALVGLAVGFVIILVMTWFISLKWVLGLSAWLVGCFGSVIGVLVLKCWRQLVRWFS
jgi:hypothetical protein